MQDNPSKPNALGYPSCPEGLNIRARTPQDAPGIAALHGMPGFRHGTLRLPHERAEDILRHIASQTPEEIHLVAVLDNMIVGDAGLMPHRGRRAHAASIGMGVHDDFCSRGIGRALLGELVDMADQWLNIRRMELTVYTDNIAAIQLYESFGFESEGLLRDYGFRAGGYADVFTMARLRP